MELYAGIGILTKLFRAEQHLHALQDRLAVHLDQHGAATMTCKYEVRPMEDGQKGLLRIDGDYDMFPNWIDPTTEALISDAVHNMRGALDHLAWNLVESPTADTYFPIQDVPTSTTKRGRPAEPSIAGGALKGVRAALAKFQPWYPDGVTTVEHGLRLIREMSNEDKHRRSHVRLRRTDVSERIGSGVREAAEGTVMIPREYTVDSYKGLTEVVLTPASADAGAQMRTLFEKGTVTVDTLTVITETVGTIITVPKKRADGTYQTVTFDTMPALWLTYRYIRDEVIPTLAPLTRERDEFRGDARIEIPA